MKKITYIISNINRAQEFEWVAQYLNRKQFELNFILIDQLETPEIIDEFKKFNRNVTHYNYSTRFQFIPIFIKLFFQLIQIRPQIVHCHLPEATYLGLTAAFLAGIKNRIYTRHHSTFNHVYHLKSVWVDRYCNTLATNIVSITQLVSNTLINLEKVSPEKIFLIHHAIDIKRFEEVSDEDVYTLKKKHNIPLDHYIVGVISRYTEWKGVQYIIPAFGQFNLQNPKTHLVLANAKKGEYTTQIATLLQQLPTDSYTEIEFESNLFALHKSFDVFIHTPIDAECEAFGQIYIEALAAQTPCIFTLSGIANEFIQSEYNATVVPYKSSKAILHSLIALSTNKQLCTKLTESGFESIQDKFTIAVKLAALEKLYKDAA